MIQWPCLFKFDGDDELLYLATETVLSDEFESLIWSDDDFLVDSVGQVYGVQFLSQARYHYQRVSRRLNVVEVTELIQAHQFALAEVCLVKIQFLTVREAILSLASFQSAR